mgnify:CR=1 FL=1
MALQLEDYIPVLKAGTARQIAASAVTTGTADNISLSALTTGKGINMNDADAITTGTILNIASNASGTGTRSLVKIVNDNTLATGATALEVQQDSTAVAILVSGTVKTAFKALAVGSSGVVFEIPETTDTPVQTTTIGTAVASGFIKIKLPSGTNRYILCYS